MNHLLKSFATKVSTDLLLFRSLSKPFNSNLRKMSSTITAEDLRAKSAQASELIEKLKQQIEAIKVASSPANMAERAKNLQQENETLKKKVEELKRQLEAAEAKNGKAPSAMPLQNVSNVPAVTATATASAATPDKKEKKQKQPQQENNKQTPSKSELSGI
jgi:predicted  nucleic acid-binding Zn-ribbon protein